VFVGLCSCLSDQNHKELSCCAFVIVEAIAAHNSLLDFARGHSFMSFGSRFRRRVGGSHHMAPAEAQAEIDGRTLITSFYISQLHIFPPPHPPGTRGSTPPEARNGPYPRPPFLSRVSTKK
jgi:hypothetical protein